jgi:hypothetical protein
VPPWKARGIIAPARWSAPGIRACKYSRATLRPCTGVGGRHGRFGPGSPSSVSLAIAKRVCSQLNASRNISRCLLTVRFRRLAEAQRRPSRLESRVMPPAVLKAMSIDANGKACRRTPPCPEQEQWSGQDDALGEQRWMVGMRVLGDLKISPLERVSSLSVNLTNHVYMHHRSNSVAWEEALKSVRAHEMGFGPIPHQTTWTRFKQVVELAE